MTDVTLCSNKTDRRDYRIEMANTAGQPGVYTVIEMIYGGKLSVYVLVQRDGKNGKRWAMLNDNVHRHQIRRVLDVFAKNK